MEKTFTHGVTYNFEGEATIADIAASLLANERLVKEAVGVIDACYEGLQVEELRIKLTEISQNSPLKEIVAVTIVIAFQEDLTEEVPDFIKQLTGIDIPDNYDTMVTVVFVSVALWGGMALAEKVFKGNRPAKRPKLDDAYQNVTHVAGDLLQISPDAYREVLDERLGGKKERSIRKISRDFFRPAKANGATSIETTSPITIDQDVLRELPSVVDEAIVEPKTDIHLLERTVVKLRAHDLDRGKAGWAGIIDEISVNRVNVHLEPTLSPDSLFEKTHVTAQVRVYTREDDNGDMKPYLYVIQEVHE